MYGTRNGQKRAAMQDKSNVPFKEANPSNDPQKIPLTEVAQTLRPRRGCKKNLSENNCKENNVPANKSGANNRAFKKPDTSQKPVLRSENVSCVRKELPVPEKNVKILKKENSSKTTILQSIQNFGNLKNNKTNSTKSKATLKAIYQNEENHEKKKVAASLKNTQESGIIRRFPKWISNGMESLKRGKKRALNLDVYDIETDKDFMLEKSLTKKAVVKKARITKTKNYPTKHNSCTSAKTQLNKKRKTKKVVEKFPDKVSSQSCSGFEKPKVQMAKNGLLASQKQNVTEQNLIDLHLEKDVTTAKTVAPIKESEQMKQIVASDKQKTSSKTDNAKIGKSSEKLETPEKCQHTETPHCNNKIISSFNIESFPMPQSSSTPQNAIKSNIPSQMPCSSLNATLLEIPQSQEMQVDFSDSEFLSPEKVTSDSDEIQLFDSSVNEKEKQIVKGEVQNKQSAVKNLSASLSPKHLKEMNRDDPKNSQSMISGTLPQKEKIPSSTNKDNLLQLEKEILTLFPSQEENSLSPAVTTSDGKSNLNQDKQSETPEQVKEKTPRPKRACQQKKPVIEESLELSFENDAHEITLFETPEKEGSRKEAAVECSPSKTILRNLFPEEWNVSPIKVVSVEERVLKPRKSYHSPAPFRRHVMKAKRENKVQKKTQTKHDKLIESLNNHFSELENMDLCIE